MVCRYEHVWWLFRDESGMHTALTPLYALASCGQPAYGQVSLHRGKTTTPLAVLSLDGMRAVNFYMLVERERWQGSPITRHGAYRAEYADLYQRLSRFLQQYPLGAFRRQTPVVGLLNYDLLCYAMPLSPVWDVIGAGSTTAARSTQLTLTLALYTIQIWEAQHD